MDSRIRREIFPVGTSPEYERLFKRIILELQKCQEEYEETLVHLLQLLLIEFERELTREHVLKDEYMVAEWKWLFLISVPHTIWRLMLKNMHIQRE